MSSCIGAISSSEQVCYIPCNFCNIVLATQNFIGASDHYGLGSSSSRRTFSNRPSPIPTDNRIATRPPEKRQRVPSAYNQFIKEEIHRIKTNNPEISHREAFSTAAKNWAHFPHIHFGLMLETTKKVGLDQMASLPTDRNDILAFSFDPKVNTGVEVSIGADELIEGKANVSRSDVLDPKLKEGAFAFSCGLGKLPLEDDGIIEGVGGSERAPEDAATGKEKPKLPLSRGTAAFDPCFATNIEGRDGLFPKVCLEALPLEDIPEVSR
ncbi:hypothetical protein Syun_011124 [Stephania yunnanensis]|uniref:YABBY protein C-terminal domain-containing protein n=1 Tax=Stephania yunnanensis TaxID=152371 RepID=A0AAP0JXN9_9MAGN